MGAGLSRGVGGAVWYDVGTDGPPDKGTALDGQLEPQVGRLPMKTAHRPHAALDELGRAARRLSLSLPVVAPP